MARIWIFGANVNTDQIVPGRYAPYMLKDESELRKYPFVEARPEFASTVQPGDLLMAGPNFGCGSSREHAPWALLDFGFRCVIAPSFADIFYNNCFKNGILPIKLPQEEIDKLLDDASRGANATITIDLPNQEIRGPDGGVIRFDIDPFLKRCLMEGLDDIGLTLEKAEHIDSFETEHRTRRPWA